MLATRQAPKGTRTLQVTSNHDPRRTAPRPLRAAGDKLQLQGLNAFDAAVHCASLSNKGANGGAGGRGDGSKAGRKASGMLSRAGGGWGQSHQIQRRGAPPTGRAQTWVCCARRVCGSRRRAAAPQPTLCFLC